MHKIPVLIDCDTGIDDMLSFTVALSSERLNILGITTAAGNQTLDITTRNTLQGLALMGRSEIPVAVGEAKPLERPLRDAGYIHGENGLGTYTFEEQASLKPVALHAVEFMRNILLSHSDKVTIIALAPLTNIALLFRRYPEVKNKVERIVFMGGSVFSGNPTPVSTFNVLADPEAAKEVLKSGVEFEMVPLDTTRHAYTTEEELEKLKSIGNKVADMAYEVTKFYNDAVNKSNNAKARFKGLCIHDLCVVIYVTHPEYFTTKRYYADVETKGELTTGFTMIDHENILGKKEEEKNVLIVDSVDRAGYMDTFLEALQSYGR